jgi:hypothetical protein
MIGILENSVLRLASRCGPVDGADIGTTVRAAAVRGNDAPDAAQPACCTVATGPLPP